MTQQHSWLATHPYLQPLASLHAEIKSVLDGIIMTSGCFSAWDRYSDDFCAGVPLLQSAKAAIDLGPVEKLLILLMDSLSSKRLPHPLGGQVENLHAELHRDAGAPRRALAWLLHNDTFVCSCPGLMRYLGWTVLSLYLRPLTEAFALWRSEEGWLRSYCPVCGSLPAMAQLIGKDAARLRLLVCGHCGSRWWYKRMDCPFCERQNNHQLSALVMEGEADFRIDYCESCHGYLKTYTGDTNENVLLADWTSIHLDLAAQDRGLARLAASLYEL